MGENANGMNRINERIYTDAQTSPILSGLSVSVNEELGGIMKDIHRRIIHLQQVPAFQIGLDESWTQRWDKIDGREERKGGESEGNIERWQGWDRVDERADDKPRADGDERRE